MSNYKGVNRDTLAEAGENGVNIEVVWGLLFAADPEHPEIQRALRAGSIELAEFTEEPIKQKSKRTAGGE